MQKPISTDRLKKDYHHTCLAPVDAHVRALLESMIKDNENAPVKPHIIKNLEDYSIGRRAMALLGNHVLTPNPRCRDCNGKGYQLERGEKLPPTDPENPGKPMYKWHTRACTCIMKTVKPTANLDSLNKPVPIPEPNVETGPDKGIPSKKRRKATGAPNENQTSEQSINGPGNPGSKKRTRKV